MPTNQSSACWWLTEPGETPATTTTMSTNNASSTDDIDFSMPPPPPPTRRGFPPTPEVDKYKWEIPVISAPRSRSTLPSSHVIPMACWSCNSREISNTWILFEERIANPRVPGETKQEVLSDLGIMERCCRCMMISHLDLPTSRTTAGQIFA